MLTNTHLSLLDVFPSYLIVSYHIFSYLSHPPKTILRMEKASHAGISSKVNSSLMAQVSEFVFVGKQSFSYQQAWEHRPHQA